MLKISNLFFIIALVSSIGVKAQFGSVPMSIQTPYGNATIYQNTYMPMYFGNGGIPFKKYQYTVILKNDSVFTGKGKMQIKKGIAHLILKGKNSVKEFYPKDTKEVYRVLENKNKIYGIPSFEDSCWLFKVYDGKINEFAIVPEWGTPFFSAVQKGEGSPVYKITKENVIPLVNDNPKALKKAEKNKLNAALEIYNNGK